MKVLVLGGTRYAGIHLINDLISTGHDITIATRGKTVDNFGDSVKRKIVDRQNPESLFTALNGDFYDVVIDNLAYCSNDIQYILDAVHTKKYVLTSTVSVYDDFHSNMRELELDTKKTQLKWCGRDDYDYGEIKRQAEAALFQAYTKIPSVAVRFPWIFGSDDYTKRLFFYVEHIFCEKAMHIDNAEARLSFINSNEAGRFLAWCANNQISGYVNACSNGTVSLSEIIDYAEKRIGKKALIHENGEPAPLNGVPSFSLDTSIAQGIGFEFLDINEWIYPTIDFWIETELLRMET